MKHRDRSANVLSSTNSQGNIQSVVLVYSSTYTLLNSQLFLLPATSPATNMCWCFVLGEKRGRGNPVCTCRIPFLVTLQFLEICFYKFRICSGVTRRIIDLLCNISPKPDTSTIHFSIRTLRGLIIRQITFIDRNPTVFYLD